MIKLATNVQFGQCHQVMYIARCGIDLSVIGQALTDPGEGRQCGVYRAANILGKCCSVI